MLSKFLTLFILLSSLAFAQVEEQRKYVFTDISDNSLNIINGGGVLNGLTIKKHSDYVYYDLYLDSENRTLLKNKLSLRFRMRKYPDGSGEYGMQLKSEMLKPGDIRMEIDETEIDYMQIFYQGQKISLQETIQTLINRFEVLLSTQETTPDKDASIQRNVDIISTWIHFKIDSAIGPFQKLKNLGIEHDELKTIRPVLVGKSLRGRSHVFIDRNNTTADLRDFAPSVMDYNETPVILQSTQFVWAMETSFDQETFFSLEKTGSFNIKEFEVENKYRPIELGRQVLNRFETELMSIGGEINLESKYLQSMKALD